MEWILCSFGWTAARGGPFLIFLTLIQSISESASFKERLERFPWFVKIGLQSLAIHEDYEDTGEAVRQKVTDVSILWIVVTMYSTAGKGMFRKMAFSQSRWKFGFVSRML
jgi:hypothetical protein